jgi:hypothetical protein
VEEEEPDLETAFKVVAIMQTITEDLDESGKRAWRKMLGISTTHDSIKKDETKKESKQSNSDRR